MEIGDNWYNTLKGRIIEHILKNRIPCDVMIFPYDRTAYLHLLDEVSKEIGAEYRQINLSGFGQENYRIYPKGYREAEQRLIVENAKEKYVIEASKDGRAWQTMAVFHHGQESRYDRPFDPMVACQEATDFKRARAKDWPHVRLVIEIIKI